jgi:hypothetical protein
MRRYGLAYPLDAFLAIRNDPRRSVEARVSGPRTKRRRSVTATPRSARTRRWRQAAETFIKAKRTADSASAQLDAAKEQLTALARHPSESGFGVQVTRYWKKGAVDYKRIPELTGADLEKYRASGREEVRVSVS